ncbi:MAG: T9SS type A sorting domain-containing protein, partial [Ignavibacteria bacterium]
VSGVIWRTTNSGLFWMGECVSLEPINDIIFLDSFRAVGVGGDFEYGASIVRTTNGGLNWQYNELNVFGAGQAISFRTPAEAWIPLGFSGTWLYTLNSGTNWTELDVPDSASAYDVQFTDPYHGWSVGNYGRIFKYNINKAIGISNQNQNELPNVYKLYQNYPNPFNPSTTIEYYLLKPSRVKIILYDLLGREIKTLLHYVQKAGNHKINFNSDGLASGIYYYKLETDDGFSDTKKMVILR